MLLVECAHRKASERIGRRPRSECCAHAAGTLRLRRLAYNREKRSVAREPGRRAANPKTARPGAHAIKIGSEADRWRAQPQR
eukprot:3538376-Prymnesium_polylepis.1